MILLQGTSRSRTAWRATCLLFGAIASLLCLALQANPAGAALAAETPEQAVSVIVRELPRAGDSPERAVRRLGGRLGRHIALIDGFVAERPVSALTGNRWSGNRWSGNRWTSSG